MTVTGSRGGGVDVAEEDRLSEARRAIAAKQGRCRVLMVPGFVADTYSEIERSYVELSARHDPDMEYIWLVPDMRCRHNRFARPESRETLTEPVWVPALRRHGIQYIVGNIDPYNMVHNYMLFRDVFRRYRIDAVYTHFGFERFWATFFGKLWGKRTIWNEHWDSLGTRYVLAKRLFYRLFVDEFISVSRFIASRLPRGSYVHIVPNAVRVQESSWSDDNGAVRRRLAGVNERDIVVLMVAAFRREKRHDLALAVCSQVLGAAKNVMFIFLGDGEERAGFLQEVRRLGLAGRVQAPGYVDNVEEYYASADLCVLTSVKEPFGYVVLEAMRHRLPIVAFNSGGPAEVIRDGETGFLVPEGDTAAFSRRVLELIHEPRRRKVLGRAGERLVRENYSRDVWIGRINALLRGGARSGGPDTLGRVYPDR